MAKLLLVFVIFRTSLLITSAYLSSLYKRTMPSERAAAFTVAPERRSLEVSCKD